MSKKLEGKLIILAIVFGIPLYFIYQILTFIHTKIIENNNIILWVISSLLLAFIANLTYTEVYFKSKKFKKLKESISSHTNNCNELNHYIEELKRSYINIKSYNYGEGNITDNSLFNFKRKEWSKALQSSQTHQCSASVVKNANSQPIKYLCKYFSIDKNEESLSKFEKVLTDFTSVEQGKDLIKKERESILHSIQKSIPFLIRHFSKAKLIRKLGFEKVDISDAYIPTFCFQYVSAGGNSSSKCEIKLTIENLNHLVNFLNDGIKWTKSIAGQRALMTLSLREKIKKRDDFKCCNCNLGIKDEPNLLLEIDHIIPLSKGGKTIWENLQTLCWRCNRSKGSKTI